MNELIKELKDKCYESVSERNNDNEYDMEKFAELIVRECIAQVQKDENGPAYEAAGRIARHFRKGE